MLLFIACLIGQISPAAKDVTVEEFMSRCEKRQADLISFQIEQLEEKIKHNRGNGKLLGQLKPQLATLKTRQKNPGTPTPISLDQNSLSLGDVGDTKFSSVQGEAVWKPKVLQVVKGGIVLCEFGDSTFAVTGINTANLVDDDRFSMDGVWSVSGTFTYNTVVGATKKVNVLSPWKHEAEWKAALKKRAEEKAAAKAKPPAPKPKSTTTPAPKAT
jgi:TPP-dependent 2-oxoacid decarboxylase